MDKKIQLHFQQADPVIFCALKTYGLSRAIQVKEPNEYFFQLCRSINNQQLSNKAAATIFERFCNLFPKKEPTAHALHKLSIQKLKSAGLSRQKIAYLKDIAKKIESKEIVLEKLQTLSNEEVIESLTKIKGIGLWTAQMFLMFSLGREDVFSFGDAGLRNAMKKLYSLQELTKDQAEQIATRWAPYRSWACLILWESLKKKVQLKNI